MGLAVCVESEAADLNKTNQRDTMRTSSTLLLFGLVAAVRGGLFVQDGQEYEYFTTITSAAGTMDVATHSAGEQYTMKVQLQVKGKKLNMKISDLKRAVFVGGHLPTDNPFETKAKFEPDSDIEVKFSIELGDNGLFKSLVVPSGMPIWQKNLVKGWANQLQINAASIKERGMPSAFKSEEKSLHGDCEVSYTATENMIIKSVSHMADCKNRKYRLIDDWRGYRCDMDFKNPEKKTSVDGLFSMANTVYKMKKEGGQYVIEGMATTSALIAQFYETEGMSHFAHANLTSVLLGKRASPNDISVSGETLTDLAYEFEDAQAYKWNKDRDLKAREPFLSSGNYYEDDMGTLRGAVKKILTNLFTNLHKHETDEASIQKAHKMSIEAAYPALFAMDYSTLKNQAEEFFADKSEKGVWMSNMFNEYLGNTGTTASAMVIRDLIMAKKFNNDRDAGRILTSVPFSIRRPNKQLVKEYAQLLTWGGAERFLKMAIPLSFSHLVKVTCMRAGSAAEQMECFSTLGKEYVDKFHQDFKNANNRDDKYLYLEALQNIKFGGQAEKLKDMILGKDGEKPEFRAQAIWSAAWEGMVHGGVNYFFPVFANQKDDHEVRINALAMIFYSKPTSTDFARILAVLKTETDYEVINMAYSLFEQFANTVNPCHADVRDKAKFFLKYMKQYSRYETEYGFGVSKAFEREYQQNKYGYGGAYQYWVVGSHKSTTPLTVGMSISNTFFRTYQSNRLHVSIRLEGLAKALIRKFKTMDPGTWKVDDLQKILNNEMNIRERPDQPVRVKLYIMVKQAVVFSRAYDENSAKEGGKLHDFFQGIKNMGDEYSINHQRVLQTGAALYEQPSEIGMPLAYMSSMTIGASIKANIKRGNNRGLLFRNFDYELNFFGNAHDGMMVTNPGRKLSYSIFQSRIYHIHVPRKILIGVNLIKKQFKMSVSRPEFNDPAQSLMHAQTIVTVKGTRIGEEVKAVKKSCPTCESRVVSRGPGAAKGRIVRDIDNKELGYMNHMEYFDCEMDIRQGNTVGRAMLAFMPYNKNPQTPFALASLGLRQIAAYVALFPRAEKCGIMTKWSQSPTNPTTDFELTVKVKREQNGEKLFYRGRKSMIQIHLKANGQPARRNYRLQMNIETSPNRLKNKIKIKMERAPVAQLGVKPYTVCMEYQSQYPDFGREYMAMTSEKLAVNGKAKVQYGEGLECGSQGDIQIDFKHETTNEGHNDLKEKWYYKQCMAQKASPEWKTRGGDKLPTTEPCYMTLWDATSARHYHWEVKFNKLTNRMKNIISNVRSIVAAGLIPYYDENPDSGYEVSINNDVGPFLNADVIFKNSDKNVDLKIETSQGVREYEDYPLKLEWTKSLRNMKLDRMIGRLIQSKIIYPCVATVGSVQTNDNVTYAYNAGSCWTLTSGHCGPNPAYGVFAKKSGNKLVTKAYFGGHEFEIGTGGDVKVNGASKSLTPGKEEVFKQDDVEIFKYVKWGSTVHVYSFMRVWVATDNTFVQVLPAPSTRGQHCGICGTFNRNIYDEWMGKDGQTLITSAAAMVDEWKWKC